MCPYARLYLRLPGTFAWMDKPKPVLQHPRDAIVRVTLASICTSDLHIKHGAVPGRFQASPWDMKWWAS